MLQVQYITKSKNGISLAELYKLIKSHPYFGKRDFTYSFYFFGVDYKEDDKNVLIELYNKNISWHKLDIEQIVIKYIVNIGVKQIDNKQRFGYEIIDSRTNTIAKRRGLFGLHYIDSNTIFEDRFYKSKGYHYETFTKLIQGIEYYEPEYLQDDYLTSGGLKVALQDLGSGYYILNPGYYKTSKIKDKFSNFDKK